MRNVPWLTSSSFVSRRFQVCQEIALRLVQIAGASNHSRDIMHYSRKTTQRSAKRFVPSQASGIAWGYRHWQASRLLGFYEYAKAK